MTLFQRSFEDRQIKSYIDADTNDVNGRTIELTLPILGEYVITTGTESINLAVGGAGTTGYFGINIRGNILSADGTRVGYCYGTDSDTSFVITSGSALNKEVKFDDSIITSNFLSSLNNGEYAIDYYLGIIYYKKLNSTTSLGISYKYALQKVTN